MGRSSHSSSVAQLSSGSRPSLLKSKPIHLRKSRSKRAGLTFSVSRVDRKLHEGAHGNRISSGASVYLAAVLQYLTSELVDMSVIESKKKNKKRITPRLITLAIKTDNDFNSLFKDITIAQGGVLPKPTKEIKSNSNQN
ncbi:hypothetical protein B9Z55_002131 [Caenorhabditis nigoni]|uniref:Histone H2A n=1 Tax=Caenorhabditis nigoni TaxID=1611254 RepID=A0A2G5VJA6_9PELO|nr:hypothetical protein B9Z55_002131 [Caenorhabditis nigoni]